MIGLKVISLAIIALFTWAAAAAPEPAVSVESRIVGGTPTTIEEFPYIVAIIFFLPEQGIYVQQCVGSLISSYHVLTTTFCFTDTYFNFVLVRAGSTNSMSGGVLSTIRDVIKHPLYVESPRENDIAIAVLSFPLTPSDTIQFLELPSQNISVSGRVQIASWGFETELGPQVERLQTINMAILVERRCVDLDVFPKPGPVVIDDRIICVVQNPPVGMCLGDFGAPMVLDDEVVGLASWYQDCGESNWPDVFTNIYSFTTWILEVAVAPRGSELDATLASTAVPRIRV